MKQPNSSTEKSEDTPYWEERYRENNTPWDLGMVSPPLKNYIDRLTDHNLSVLIPGCGNAYEASYLLERGFRKVTLIDLSATLTSSLQSKYKGQPIEIINANFFDHKGNYDLILEQTFFCAIHPSLRKAYVNTCYDLLNKDGKIAGVLFNKKFAENEPPYIASDNEYRNLFENLFHFNEFLPCTTSAGPRLGCEVSFEFQKKKQ